MAELYLVRHGQASFGSNNYDQLSPLGVQQALWLGEYFAERHIGFDRWVIGTQQRHLQTAEAIASGMKADIDIQPERHPGLNEYDFYQLFAALGEEHTWLKQLAKADKPEFYRGLKQVLKLWLQDQLSGPLPERWMDFYTRVSNALSFIQQTDAKRILVISSGGPIGTIAGKVMQSPPEVAIELNMQIYNSSVSHYFFNRQSLRLASFNTLPHLDQAQRREAITYG